MAPKNKVTSSPTASDKRTNHHQSVKSLD